MPKTKIITFFVTIFLTNLVNADEDSHQHTEDHEFEEHVSHVHGHATANVSYEHNILNINLSFSSVDVFGFEHDP